MSDAPPEATQRRAVPSALWPWGAILAVALAMRVWGLFDGVGYGLRDEMNYVPKAVRYGGGDLNPHYFQNPPLASYLMFVGVALRYAAERVAGDLAGALDFKARFLAGDPAAFTASRAVVLALGLVSVLQVAVLAREAAHGLSDAARRAAGVLAALGLVASQLHVERCATATNDVLGMLAYSSAAQAALVLARTGTMRAALVAGALVGLSAGAKYTGAIVCVPVGLAALLAAGRTTGARWRLALAAGAASAGAFLAVCPWAVLDAATFRAHVADLMVQSDRWVDGQGWRRYIETLWGPGLGPLWTGASAAAVVILAVAVFRGDASRRVRAAVCLACVVPLAAYLFSHTNMANGRYLLPAYPALAAFAAVEVVRRTADGGPARRVAFAAAAVCVAVTAAGVPARAAQASLPFTQDAARDWLHANVPDGSHVVLDWLGPRLPEFGARREFEGRVSSATWERLVPAWRLTTAFRYFALPVETLAGTDVRVDDLDRLRAHGPVWIVQTDHTESVFAKLPAGDYPPLEWYRRTRDLPVVHQVVPGPALRGPTVTIRLLR